MVIFIQCIQLSTAIMMRSCSRTSPIPSRALDAQPSPFGCTAPFRTQRPCRRGSGLRDAAVTTLLQCSDDASSAVTTASASRRDILLSTGSALLLAGTPITAPPAQAEGLEQRRVPVKYLSALQKNAQKAAFKARAEQELKKVLTADDAPAALRLVLHDAATYDVDSGVGGLNGSIVLNEELNRPENKDLSDIVRKLESAKGAIDATSAAASIPVPPISWADVMVLGAKVAAERSWFMAKKTRLGAGADVDTISKAFGADFPVFLGRQDATAPDSPVAFPDSGSPLQVRDFMKKLGTPSGAGTGLFAAKPLFWERPSFVIWTAAQPNPEQAETVFAAADPQFAELKSKYDRSRRTVTRTDYEVDFIDYFTRLTGSKLGAKFVPDPYVVDSMLDIPKL